LVYNAFLEENIFIINISISKDIQKGNRKIFPSSFGCETLWQR